MDFASKLCTIEEHVLLDPLHIKLCYDIDISDIYLQVISIVASVIIIIIIIIIAIMRHNNKLH